MPETELLEDCWDEHEWAAQRKKSIQTIRNERKQRRGAPFITVNGRDFYYPKDLAKEWLRSKLVRSPRVRAHRHAHRQFAEGQA
jgi:hypothetical protein